MSHYSHIRSLDHAERILRGQASEVRHLAGDDFAGSREHKAALRGKAVAYSEAADLLAVVIRKWQSGELDEREQIAREIEATADAECGGYRDKDNPELVAAFAKRGIEFQPHYPDEGWSFCDGCSMAQSSDQATRRIADLVRNPQREAATA